MSPNFIACTLAGLLLTDQEVAHMLDEVKYSRFTDTGEVSGQCSRTEDAVNVSLILD